MPHLRLEIAQEWLTEEFKASSGFDAKKLLDHLIEVVSGIRMPNVKAADDPTLPAEVPLINLSNLKHAIVPLYYAHVSGDPAKRFLHVTLSAGNDTPGRTAEIRFRAAELLGHEVDKFVGDLPGLTSVTVHVQDINRERGYSTTGERKKKRSQS